MPVTVQGQKMLTATLAAAGKALDDATDPAQKVGRMVAARARADAPVLSGRLAGSVRSAGSAQGAEITSALAYANRTHWGYRRYGQAAQPFISNALDTLEPPVIREFVAWVDHILGRVKGTT